MQNTKFNQKSRLMGLIVVVLFAGIGIALFARTSGYTSARSQNAVLLGSVAEKSGAIGTPSAAPPGSRNETPSGEIEINDDMSKAVLSVAGMSCSGCIYTIKSSLVDVTGIRDVLVNLPAGEAEVYFNHKQLNDVEKIAAAVTKSGYPAKVIAVLTADQIRDEKKRVVSRAANYIASVGDWDISRADFNTELNHATTRYAAVYGKNIFSGRQGKVFVDNLKAQIVSRLVDEGIQIQEIKKAGFALAPDTVDSELNTFLAQRGIDRGAFITELEKSGYGFDYYMKRFENRVLINKYLEQRILEGAENDFERQRRYDEWFKNAGLLAKTVFYDKDIERLMQTRIGGECSGGNNCRQTK